MNIHIPYSEVNQLIASNIDISISVTYGGGGAISIMYRYKTGVGPLLLLLAVIIWIIGFIVTSRQAESRQKSTMRTFTSIAVFVVFISFIVDAVMAKE